MVKDFSLFLITLWNCKLDIQNQVHQSVNSYDMIDDSKISSVLVLTKPAKSPYHQNGPCSRQV